MISPLFHLLLHLDPSLRPTLRPSLGDVLQDLTSPQDRGLPQPSMGKYLHLEGVLGIVTRIRLNKQMTLQENGPLSIRPTRPLAPALTWWGQQELR